LGELEETGIGSKVFRPRESAWFTTSDRVEIADDFLTIAGRADALVKILGELVSPQCVTQRLVTIGMNPANFAVLAVPDDRKGHRLVLVYEAKYSSHWDKLLQNYQRQVPGYQRIDQVIAVAEMPRSALGKILIQELRKHVL
jgi:acyl-CoA synthetase (AMP-forming)/AMP-acid ligase II